MAKTIRRTSTTTERDIRDARMASRERRDSARGTDNYTDAFNETAATYAAAFAILGSK